MQNFYLVTTALEKTWPEDIRCKPLFLGEWCLIFTRKKYWKRLDGKLLTYHWDNRGKLLSDYKYINKLFERILSILYKELNQYHKINFNKREWRIIIGPWLSLFLLSVFDKWENISRAFQKNQILGTTVLPYQLEDFTPDTMEDFSFMAKTDEWNHVICCEIIKFLRFKPLIRKNLRGEFLSCPKTSRKYNPNSKFWKFLSTLTVTMSKKNKYFFIDTYMKQFDLIKLQLKLSQIPRFYFDNILRDPIKTGCYKKVVLSGFDPQNMFEKFVNELIFSQMPRVYLESFSIIQNKLTRAGWPTNPEVIWTSNSFYMNDYFKIWSAKNVSEGSKLVIGQHGGHYGLGLFSSLEYHELKISDYYLTWGWSNKSKKIIPLGRPRLTIPIRKKQLKAGSICLLLSSTSRYSGGIASMPVSSQWLEYLEDQFNFYSLLPESIQKSTKVRLYHQDFEWSQKERWLERFPDSLIEDPSEPFPNSLKKTGLFVGGWNSTTYLEAIASNVPTIIFWNENHNELRKEVKVNFDKLEMVGIFHRTPESAAHHVCKIWKDVPAWWERPEVIKEKNRFVSMFAKNAKNVKQLSMHFKKINEKVESI